MDNYIDNYKVFVDSLGVVYEEKELDTAKKYYEYALEQKKLPLNKFSAKGIYLMQGKAVIMSEEGDVKLELGGSLVDDNVQSLFLSRFANNCPLENDELLKGDIDYRYSDTSFSVKKGQSFVELIKKDKSSGVCTILASNMKDETDKVEAMIKCLASSVVPYKVAK